MAYLVIYMPNAPARRLMLEGQTEIGRSSECLISVDDRQLSRHHCRFENRNDRWRVIDLDSRNGTRVHGHRIADHRLSNGDSIELGSVRIVFRDGKFEQHRPADPIEAAALRKEAASDIGTQLDSASSTLNGTRFATRAVAQSGSRPPKAELPPPAKPLAFTRQPARPIVHAASGNPAAGSSSEKTGWFKTIVSRVRGS